MSTVRERWDTLEELDRNVKPGDLVQVRWTWGGGSYHAKAEVVKVNEKSIRAKLLHPVLYAGCREPIEAGRELNFPRLWNQTRTANNCFLGKSRWLVVDTRGVYQPVELVAYSWYEAKRLGLELMYGCPLEQVDVKVREETLADLRCRHLVDL